MPLKLANFNDKAIRLNIKIYKNAFWMISEKIISIFGLFFVTSFVAKYVGPNVFGKIALGMAIFQMIQVVAQMGSDNVIFKRISTKRESGLKLLYATNFLRIKIYCLLSVPVLLYLYVFSDKEVLFFSAGIAVATLFNTIDVFSIYNNAVLKSRLNTIINLLGLLIGLSLRFLIAYFEMLPILLVIPIILTSFFPFLIRTSLFYKEIKKLNNSHSPSITNKTAIKKYSRYLFFVGSGIVVSSISVAFYGRLNQFMLSGIDGSTSLGIFSVSLTLASSWVFVTQSVITSFYSEIYSEKSDSKSLMKAANLNRIIILISLIFVLFIVFVGKDLLYSLYGEQYLKGYSAMVILSISAAVSSLGTVSYRFIVKYSGYTYLSKKMLSLSLISIPISFLLIKEFSLEGAAWCTLLIEILSLTILNYFFEKKLIVKLHLKTLLPGINP